MDPHALGGAPLRVPGEALGPRPAAPPRVAPYHLRLDWLMRFAALSPFAHWPWFLRLLIRLLEGDPEVLGLLRIDPFGGKRPVAVRARLCRYRLTTPEERRRTGKWWARKLVRDMVPPVVLRDHGTLVRASGWWGP